MEKILEFELRLVQLAMKRPFQSAVGQRSTKEVLLVLAVTNNGSVGYGECSCRPDPYYSYEFNDAVITALQKFLLPPLVGRTVPDATAALSATHVRGWPFARAAALAALADVDERIHGRASSIDSPLVLRVGVTLGLRELGKHFQRTVEEKISAGYRRVRIKGIIDLDWPRLIQVLDDVARKDLQVAVDFNGCLNLRDSASRRVLDVLAESLTDTASYLEQPFAPDDLCSVQELRKGGYPLSICLDESISSPETLRSALTLDAIDICNIKPGRVGGVRISDELARMCSARGIPAHFGGMLETGIGRWAHARHAGSILPDSIHDMVLPHEYLKHDLIADALTLDPSRRAVVVPDTPAPISQEAIDAHTVQRWSAGPNPDT